MDMNTDIYGAIVKIKEKLEGIEGIKTLKIGIEPNISPSDYPIIRIVINKNDLTQSNGWENDIYFSVYFGAKIDEKVGLENIYKYLYDLEREIKNRLHNHQLENSCLIRFERTQSDNDTLKNFKILCSDFKINAVL
ncbi:hypothetical protein OFO10_05975 [Campylobacter sp. VBCF_06 NA8]|uniref:hypothetical protein n=1 Tax=Campylobacter sp. VBCF_06 NA8 TaxID=2983822 RepID=UPI0022E99E49|nr:hypothetical protein [Campylobacter sp. VBCF_06 NA8]MDA3046702.1 hypothetical protein [Campylobacter sp. VBCF_06 NA8]